MNPPTLGLAGRVKASVLRGDRIVSQSDWTRNLWLDAGLDRIADTPICDCFSVAAKGTGTTATKEDLTGGANTFSISNGTSTITRAAGARDFVTGDIGKVIKFSTTPFAEFYITAINSVSSFEVSPNASAAISTKKITIYSVQQTELDAEIGRSNTYGAGSGENGTATAGNVRTFTRTFIFPKEDDLIEVVDASNTYSQTTATVTRQTGARDFTADDVGATILFMESGLTALISAITSTTATVTPSQTNLAQSITITKPNADKTESVDGTYSRSGAVVTRVSGARDFTIDDEGKIIHFGTANTEAVITVFTNATTVTCDTSGTLAAQLITLYGFTDYSEIAFSNTLEKGDNINIRVVLDSAARVYVSTALQSSEQLKITYECSLTVEPNTSTPGDLAGVISDPGSLMSGNKNGDSAIESFATSTVGTDGETDVSFADLEPFFPGSAALSLSSDALAPLSGKVRDTGTVAVDMDADAYEDGSFLRTYRAVFGLNDAISNNWRSLMIYDPEGRSAIFTFRYDVNQKKDGDHTFEVVFKKAWGRNLDTVSSGGG